MTHTFPDHPRKSEETDTEPSTRPDRPSRPGRLEIVVGLVVLSAPAYGVRRRFDIGQGYSSTRLGSLAYPAGLISRSTLVRIQPASPISRSP